MTNLHKLEQKDNFNWQTTMFDLATELEEAITEAELINGIIISLHEAKLDEKTTLSHYDTLAWRLNGDLKQLNRIKEEFYDLYRAMKEGAA